MALVVAAEKYEFRYSDDGSGEIIPFRIYYRKAIKNRLRAEIPAWYGIKSSQYNNMQSLRKHWNVFFEKHQRPPTHEELRVELGVSQKVFVRQIKLSDGLPDQPVDVEKIMEQLGVTFSESLLDEDFFQNSVREVSPADIALLKQRFVEGQSLQEIANAKNLSFGQVRTQVNNALNRARAALAIAVD